MPVVCQNGTIYSDGAALDATISPSELKKIVRAKKAEITTWLKKHRDIGATDCYFRALFLGVKLRDVLTPKGQRLFRRTKGESSNLTVEHLKVCHRPLWEALAEESLQPKLVKSDRDDGDPLGFWLVFKKH